jgi:hypothetical protein
MRGLRLHQMVKHWYTDLKWVLSLQPAIINVNISIKRPIECSSLPLIQHQLIHSFSLDSVHQLRRMMEGEEIDAPFGDPMGSSSVCQVHFALCRE